METIITLTSYPNRFTDERFFTVLSSLVGQKDCDTVKICLTLFVGDLPQLTEPLIRFIQEHDIEILCSNVNRKAYLKFLLTAEKYGETADIITVDDDLVYESNMASCLLAAKKNHPHCILAGRVHQILYDGNMPKPYKQWKLDCVEFIEEPRDDLMATGVGGVLYPKGFFNKSRLAMVEKLMGACPTNDDFPLTKVASDGKFNRVLVSNPLKPYKRNCGFFGTELVQELNSKFNQDALCHLNVFENKNDAFLRILAKPGGGE